ncbi:apoptosis-associated speck-like protein containing a CARD [Phascolarctos cinereus]|uniref:Apoptosis-associated speck-like protein containing a CARD n=1 Tax=Phascolarctos cinereus TaxID=38626 RepID=A0A6P5LVY0_PHACI|nr:apoptosis-associated speck-like protein containing a CARD [Phascolarctos cinereus]
MSCGRDLILTALDNLTEDEFNRFKSKLLTVPLRDDCKRIPRGTLQDLDRVTLTDKIVSYYLDDYGIELTVQVLQNMHMRAEAVRLQGAVGSASRPGPAGNAAQSTQHSATACTPSGIHFVDKHRVSLISSVTLVDQVLDRLCGHVLNPEHYEAIKAENTPQNQMRRLYSFMRAWDAACKDQLLQALKDTHPFLVQKLERS